MELNTFIIHIQKALGQHLYVQQHTVQKVLKVTVLDVEADKNPIYIKHYVANFDYRFQ